MNGVAKNGAGAQQTVLFVGVQIIARGWEKAFDPFDFIMLFGQMGLHQTIGIFRPKRAQSCQLIGAGGGRKPRRDDIRLPVHPVPFSQQSLAVVIPRLSAIAQPVWRVAVHAGFARKGPQPARGCGCKKRIDRFRVDGGIGTHGCGAMRQRQIKIPVRHI